jgi:deoxyribodipyrimidine photo-lyase
MTTAPVLLWCRKALRLSENPLIEAGLQSKAPLVFLYLLDDSPENPWPLGGASKVWLHHSLQALQAKLAAIGGILLLDRSATPEKALAQWVERLGAQALLYDERVEPYERNLETRVSTLLSSRCTVKGVLAATLVDANAIRSGADSPYKVFTPFWKAALKTLPVQAPVPMTPDRWPAFESQPEGLTLEALELLPKTLTWHQGIEAAFDLMGTGAGEAGAQLRLQRFLAEASPRYAAERNFPAIEGTSKLSPHLHWGEISPQQIWNATVSHCGERSPYEKSDVGHFISEVGWREFAYQLLYHFPKTQHDPLDERFKSLPWREDAQQFRQWQEGQTGYPIVDAGLRQLWHTGWMHNRLRMVVGSFLIKDLGLSWLEGARWFWDTLVDADLASNTLGWQWVAGCGADAAPYFRVFNPVLQSEKFDAEGRFLRQWIPELVHCPDKWLHQPWAKPALNGSQTSLLTIPTASIYPAPMVDHAKAKEAALARYETVRSYTR